MSRYLIQPNSTSGRTVPPQMILADVGCPQCVLVQNVGASTIWFSENQSTLSQVDSSGNPIDGFVLAANQIIEIDWVCGQLFAVSVSGGIVNCTGWKRR